MTPKEELEVFYKCKCMDREAAVSIPYRLADEDIGEWMANVLSVAITLAHRRRAPRCRETKMEYVKLPMPENAPLFSDRTSAHLSRQ